MRISDWRSDVCSSDLPEHRAVGPVQGRQLYLHRLARRLAAAVRLRPPFGQSRICQGFAEGGRRDLRKRSEEHTSELQSLMRISYAVFCLKKKHTTPNKQAPQ